MPTSKLLKNRQVEVDNDLHSPDEDDGVNGFLYEEETRVKGASRGVME